MNEGAKLNKRRIQRSSEPMSEESSEFEDESLSLRERQEVGRFKEVRGVAELSGLRAPTAMIWLPWLLWWARGCLAVCLAATLWGVWSIENWPSPLLLMSASDGAVRCAPPALDPATGHFLPRASDEQEEFCQALENYGENRAVGSHE